MIDQKDICNKLTSFTWLKRLHERVNFGWTNCIFCRRYLLLFFVPKCCYSYEGSLPKLEVNSHEVVQHWNFPGLTTFVLASDRSPFQRPKSLWVSAVTSQIGLPIFKIRATSDYGASGRSGFMFRRVFIHSYFLWSWTVRCDCVTWQSHQCPQSRSLQYSAHTAMICSLLK